jgi:hypothetical protein
VSVLSRVCIGLILVDRAQLVAINRSLIDVNSIRQIFFKF